MPESNHAAEGRTDEDEPNTDKIDWDDVGFVQSSKYRLLALNALASSPSTPSTVATEADEDIAHISRALTGMRERDITTLLVDEDRRKGRIYGLTEYGRQLVEFVPGADTPHPHAGGGQA